VPLSDREQQILQEIEKNLRQEDPSFASQVGLREPSTGQMGRLKLGVFLFIIGLGLLVGFFVTSILLVGVGAFGSMVAGLVLAADALRRLATQDGFRGLSPHFQLRNAVQRFEQRLRDRYRRP
jgi:hypothetical protein